MGERKRQGGSLLTPELKYIIILFLITRLALVAVGSVASVLPDRVGPPGGGHDANPIVDLFMRWDAQWYISIATYNYNPNVANYPHNQAFFPLYPVLMRFGSYLTGSVTLAGLLISNLSLIIALYYIYKIAEAEFDTETAKRTVLYLLIFPTSFFFSAIYSESLFLALAAGAFYYARSKRFDASGMLGFFAALCRPIGVFIAVPLAYGSVAQTRMDFDALKERLPLLLIPLGLLLYAGVLWQATGDPLSFLSAQQNWRPGLDVPFVALVLALSLLPFARERPRLLAAGFVALACVLLIVLETTLQVNPYQFMQTDAAHAQILVDFAFAVIAFALAYWSALHMRLDYALYAFLALLVPLATKSLMSFPRLMLAAFPLFIALAALGKDRRINALIIVLSVVLSIVLFSLFVNWYWAG